MAEKRGKKNDKDVHLLIIGMILALISVILEYGTIGFPLVLRLCLFLVGISIAIIISLKSGYKFDKGFPMRVLKYSLVYIMLVVGSGSLVFNVVNNVYIYNYVSTERDFFSILRTSTKPHRGSGYSFYIDFLGKETSIDIGYSAQSEKVVKDSSLRSKSFVELEYKKGLLGTYMVINQELIAPQ